MDNYRRYTQAAMLAMAGTTFQRICDQHLVISDKVIADYMTALEAAKLEAPMQKFLAQHPYLISQMTDYAAPLCKWVKDHPKLGKEYEPDFMTCRIDSLGLRWTLIEIQKPEARLLNSQGRLSEDLNEALGQIDEWRTWIAENGEYARKDYPGLYPDASGLIIIGRAEKITDRERKRARALEVQYRIEIRSYDAIARQARIRRDEREGMRDLLNISGDEPCPECDGAETVGDI